MKNFIIILFSTFYLLTSIGGNFNLHYCGGNLKSISFISQKSCCADKMENKGCCQNKTIVVKANDKHQSSKIDKINFAKIVLILDNSIPEIYHTSSYTNETEVSENFHSPPIPLKLPIYLKNKVLII